MAIITQQSMWNVMESLTEEKKKLVMNFAIKLSESEISKNAEHTDFDAKMDRCREWAEEAGLTPDDITASIKAVRQRRRQKA